MKESNDMNNPIRVKDLRTIVSDVTTEPGYYIWWFNEDDTNTLLSVFDKKDLAKYKIQMRKMEDGHTYYALYFGIARDLQERIKWHLGISPKHTEGAIRSDTLSTLRNTIASILTKGVNPINLPKEIFDVDGILDNCYWEYFPTKTKADAEKEETARLSKNAEYIFPLNIQKNHKYLDEKGRILPRKVLSPLRREHKAKF